MRWVGGLEAIWRRGELKFPRFFGWFEVLKDVKLTLRCILIVRTGSLSRGHAS